jgi:hypothetical protein
MQKKILAAGLVPLLAACLQSPGTHVSQAGALPTAPMAHAGAAGLVRREMPAEDPGPPFYARVGMQVLEQNGWVAIPFYRSPALVPADFNLLEFYHFPGPGGPGAFAAPLLMKGFLLIEPDAPLGTFPRQVELGGEGTPVWFVPSAAFHAAVADRRLTIGELRALGPRYGIATRYHETLHPRAADHKILIEARGTLDGGGTFTLSLAHIGDSLRSMTLEFR